MKKTLIAVAVLGAGLTPVSLMAQDAADNDAAIGKQVYAMQKVEEKQIVGTVSDADAGAFRILIGDKCIGLPRENFTEVDGQYKSPWAKDALEGTIAAGNPEDFVCAPAKNTSDPAVGKQVFAMQEVQQKQIVGTIKAADSGAFRIQIGSQCIGLPRQNFTEKDGQFESPWAKDALEATIKAGNPADFVCPA